MYLRDGEILRPTQKNVFQCDVEMMLRMTIMKKLVTMMMIILIILFTIIIITMTISDCKPRDCTNPAPTSVDSRAWGPFAKACFG